MVEGLTCFRVGISHTSVEGQRQTFTRFAFFVFRAFALFVFRFFNRAFFQETNHREGNEIERDSFFVNESFLSVAGFVNE